MCDYFYAMTQKNDEGLVDLKKVILNFNTSKNPEKFIYHHYYFKLSPLHVFTIIRCNNRQEMKKVLYSSLKEYKVSGNTYDLSDNSSYKIYENILSVYKMGDSISFEKFLEDNTVRRVSTWIKDNIEYNDSSTLILSDMIKKYKISKYYNSFRIKNIHPGIKFIFKIEGIPINNDILYKNLKFKDF